MKIDINFDEFGLAVMELENNGKKLKYDLSETTKKSLKPEGLYDYINAYFKDVKMGDEYFNLCEEVSKNIDKITYEDSNSFVIFREYVKRAIDILDYDRFIDWFRKNHSKAIGIDGKKLPKLFIPDTVEKEFIYDPDKGETKEKTYVYSEYVDLIGLALFVRMLFPVFNDYLIYLNRTNNHPLYTLLRLLVDTKVGAEGTALDKLLIYIEANHSSMAKSNDKQHLVITAGLSDDDIIDYLAGESIFNKLLTMDFFNGQINPIGHIFSTIRYGSKFNNPMGGLFIKRQSPQGSDEDYSYFENFRKTTSLPQGTIIELQYALSDPAMIVSGLGYDLDTFNWDFYYEELKGLHEFMEVPVDEIKIYLLGWFLKNFVNPRALFYIEQRKIVELLMLAKTCLYQSNQEFIGTFLVSHHDPNASFINSTITAKSSLSKPLLQRLESLFTYSIDHKGVTYAKSIIEFGKQISNIAWKPKGNVLNRYINSDGYLIAPSNVNEVLIDYVEFILKLGK